MLGGYDMRFFTKSNSCTKNHILTQFKDDNVLQTFLPDDINLNSIDREYLLSVILKI